MRQPFVQTHGLDAKQFDPTTQQQIEALLSRAFDQTGAVLLPMHSHCC
jgi:hypothetical protein